MILGQPVNSCWTSHSILPNLNDRKRDDEVLERIQPGAVRERRGHGADLMGAAMEGTPESDRARDTGNDAIDGFRPANAVALRAGIGVDVDSRGLVHRALPGGKMFH